MDIVFFDQVLALQEIEREKCIENMEEGLWSHDPDTGERTFYLGCMLLEMPKHES